MSKRATLVLAAVVAALLSYVAVFERDSLTSSELEKRKGRVLASFVRQKVERLEIQRKGRTVILTRKPDTEGGFGAWQMIAPWQEDADEGEVDHVLGELEWLDARRTLENVSAQDRAGFGLDEPRYRVTFVAGGSRARLLVGKDDVHGQGAYAAVEGGTSVFVVPKTLIEALDHDPGHYRGKEFLGSMVTAWGRRLEISNEHGKVNVEKKQGRFWVAGEPAMYADDAQVETLMRALDDLRATRFLDGEAAERAQESLKKPDTTVRLDIIPDEGREDKSPTRVDLRLGGACPEHAGERLASAGEAGPPVCVQAEDVAPFELMKEGLRQRALFSADVSEIERFSLEAGKDALALSRSGQEWKAESGVQAVDREAVELWLDALSKLGALELLPVGSFAPRGALTLHLADERVEKIAVGNVLPDGRLTIRRDDEPVAWAYAAIVSELLVPVPERFGSLALWEHKPSEVIGIEAQYGAHSRSLALVDGSWREPGASAKLASDGRVRELVRDLSRGKALGFVSKLSRPEHGLDANASRLVLRLAPTSAGAEGPERTVSLAIGAATESGHYARVGKGAVYEVPREVLRRVAELSGAAASELARLDPPAEPGQEEPTEEPSLDEHDHEHDHDHE
jgi:hypothetical protein